MTKRDMTKKKYYLISIVIFGCLQSVIWYFVYQLLEDPKGSNVGLTFVTCLSIVLFVVASIASIAAIIGNDDVEDIFDL